MFFSKKAEIAADFQKKCIFNTFSSLWHKQNEPQRVSVAHSMNTFRSIFGSRRAVKTAFWAGIPRF
jgi:hypothetical protein